MSARRARLNEAVRGTSKLDGTDNLRVTYALARGTKLTGLVLSMRESAASSAGTGVTGGTARALGTLGVAAENSASVVTLGPDIVRKGQGFPVVDADVPGSYQQLSYYPLSLRITEVDDLTLELGPMIKSDGTAAASDTLWAVTLQGEAPSDQIDQL